MFKEHQLETYFIDQRRPEAFHFYTKKLGSSIDLFVDDGLHNIDANLNPIYLGQDLINESGIIVIEDISSDAKALWEVCMLALCDKYTFTLVECPESLFLVLELKDRAILNTYIQKNLKHEIVHF